MPPALLRLAVAALAVAAAGCTGLDAAGPPSPAPDAREGPAPDAREGPAPPPASRAPGALRVAAVDDAFQPADLAVDAGATVTFVNEGQSPHGVAMPALGLDVVLQPGASTTATFEAPGAYAYRCLFHRGMEGNVTVGGVAEPAAPAPPRDAPAPAAPPAGGVRRDVAVVDDAFQPAAARVPVGGTVVWTNRGGGHSVTFDALGIDRVLGGGETFSLTFEQVGTFAYRCAFHDRMTGTVSVVAPDDPAAGAEPPPVIALDGGHYDEAPVDVVEGTPVVWQNPGEEDVTLAFRDDATRLVVPAGGTAERLLPVGEHAWRDAREEGPWRLDDHDVGVVRVRPR